MLLAIIRYSYNNEIYESMCELRNKVLRKPLGLNLSKEDKERDRYDILIGAVENGKVLACCILTRIDADWMKIRQMAVTPKRQRSGIGKQILRVAEQLARKHHYSQVFLNARKTAVGFYEKEGYRIVGDEFVEVGIPHFRMEKTI